MLKEIITENAIDTLAIATVADVQQMVIDSLPTDKRELVVMLHGTDTKYDTPVLVHREDNQLESQWEQWYDMVDGSVKGRRVISYTYYDTGEVDLINVVEYDGNDKEVTNMTIKHYIDGRQPEVI